MAHITKFKIDGLLGRKSPVECVLNRDVNVFFGDNGSGKTSLLKILHSAMWGTTNEIRAIPFTSAEVEIYSIDLGATLVRKLASKKLSHRKLPRRRPSVTSDGEISDIAEEEGATWESIPPDPAKRRWRHMFLPTTRLFLGAGGNDVWRLSEEELDTAFAKVVEAQWLRHYSSVLTAVRLNDMRRAGDQALARPVG